MSLRHHVEICRCLECICSVLESIQLHDYFAIYLNFCDRLTAFYVIMGFLKLMNTIFYFILTLQKKKKCWYKEKIHHIVFNRFICLKAYENGVMVFRKCLYVTMSNSLIVCYKKIVGDLSQKLAHEISQNFKLSANLI